MTLSPHPALAVLPYAQAFPLKCSKSPIKSYSRSHFVLLEVDFFNYYFFNQYWQVTKKVF